MSSKQGIRMRWFQNDEGKQNMEDRGQVDDSSHPRASVIVLMI